MNWNNVEGNWKRFKGQLKARTDKLAADRLDAARKTREDSSEGERKPKVDIPPRRVVLRGTLAVGCSLFVPIALFSSPVTSANAATPAATKKMPKASVQYQTQPKGEQKCSNCVNFIAESNTCKLVDGQISPTGWCTLWTKKA